MDNFINLENLSGRSFGGACRIGLCVYNYKGESACIYEPMSVLYFVKKITCGVTQINVVTNIRMPKSFTTHIPVRTGNDLILEIKNSLHAIG